MPSSIRNFSENQASRYCGIVVAELLPQSGNMALLDRVLDAGENHLTAGLTVREDGLFSGPDHTVPAWVGIEYMAQTVAAYSGYQRGGKDQAMPVGFLLGTRHYQCSVGSFPCGTSLCVHVEKVADGFNGLLVFDCSIEGENISASAIINIFLPEDSMKFLAGKGLR